VHEAVTAVRKLVVVCSDRTPADGGRQIPEHKISI
jgi:hypothetical protein